MKKIIICVWVLISTLSCRTYRMLEGVSRPVLFTPDSSVFNDPYFPRPEIGYDDLLYLRGNFTNAIELKKGETVSAIIHQPTFFRAFDNFLVYPGEHIIIKKGKNNDYTFSKANNSRRRNRELSFFKTFHEIERYPIILRIDNYSLDTILDLERKLKMKIQEAAGVSRQSFDSLAKRFRVSRKFKRLTKNYLDYRYHVSLYMLYKTYKDTLVAHNLFRDKCKQLLPAFNTMTKIEQLNNYVRITFNEIANEILPYKPSRIKNENEFRSCFDTITSNFSALARDYLLSQVMYTAYTKKIEILPGYLMKYENINIDKRFKRILSKIRTRQQGSNNITTNINYNTLLSVEGKKKGTIEDVLTRYKGRPVLIDFWASWCYPCKELMPFLERLREVYKDDKIVFLSISIDREIQTWKKSVIASNREMDKEYLLTDPGKSEFVRQFQIHSIPRYMLIDASGKIVNADAPGPDDPMLKEAIDKLIYSAKYPG